VEGAGSYRLREHFADVDAELARLEAQAAQLWPREAQVLRRQGLATDARVLEVGCGPGFVTERLLALVPDGSVVGIDNDPEMVALASRRLAPEERIEFREASITETGLPDASFDAATARLVFQHLPDPAPALDELRRLLRPRGRLFVTDIDAGWPLVLEPEAPHMDEIGEAVTGIRFQRGGNPNIGRSLPRLLRDAGFADLALDAVVVHTLVDGTESVSDVVGGLTMIEPLVGAGLLRQEAFDSIREFAGRFERGEIELDGMLVSLVVSGAAAG
jgi:SAM-dependent methyltransferase